MKIIVKLTAMFVLFCMGGVALVRGAEEDVILTKEGGIIADNIHFSLELCDTSNQYTGTGSKIFQKREELKKQNGVSSLRYSLMVLGGEHPGDLLLSLQKRRGDFEFEGKLIFDRPQKLKSIGLQGWVPTSCYKKVSYEIDGKLFRFPDEFNTSLLFSGQAKRLRLPSFNGEILLEGDFYLRITDLRKWASSFKIELGFLPRSEEFQQAGMHFRIQHGLAGTLGAQLGNVNLPPYIVKAGTNWKAFRYHNQVESGSALDFSGWLDAPAGKYGRVIAQPSGQFCFQNRPGVPVRFYGPNLVDSTQYPTKVQAEEIAATLAAYGFNAVRIHHHDNLIFDPKKPTRINEERFDRLDYLLACLKKRGIYYTTDIYVSRRNIPGCDVGLPEDIKDPKEYKARIYVEDSFLNDWKRWATAFLGHVNPYTGLALKDDPALITICLVNEGNPGRLVHRFPEVEKLYRNQYNNYKKTHPQVGFEQFMAVVSKKRFDEMKNYLRQMGCKALLTDQNYEHQINLTDDRSHYDFVDTHNYWDVPFFEKESWRTPARMSQLNPLTAKPGLPGELFPTRLLGKGFTITEFCYCYPNQYRSAGPALMGAYGALQDWNGMFPFAFGHNICVWNNPPRSVNAFLDILSDPIKMFSHRIGTRLFLAGDIKPAENAFAAVVTNPYDKDYMARFSDTFSELGFLARIGSVTSFPAAVKIKAFIDMGTGRPPKHVRTPVVKDSGDLIPRLIHAGVLPRNCYEPQTQTLTAADGCLSISRKRSTFKAATPNNEVLIMKGNMQLSGKYLQVENKESFAVFALLPLDNHRIDQAKRLTLLHLTNSLETDMKFANDQMELLESWGKIPFLAQHGTAHLLLRLSNIDKIYALDTAGHRIGELPISPTTDGAEIDIDNFKYEEAIFAYEIIRVID